MWPTGWVLSRPARYGSARGGRCAITIRLGASPILSCPSGLLSWQASRAGSARRHPQERDRNSGHRAGVRSIAGGSRPLPPRQRSIRRLPLSEWAHRFLKRPPCCCIRADRAKLNLSRPLVPESRMAGKPLQESLFEKDYLVRTLGSLASQPDVALTELVANAWDAGARNVQITLPAVLGQQLIVEDDGTGLTRQEFMTRWMTLGYNRIEHQGHWVTFPPDIEHAG